MTEELPEEAQRISVVVLAALDLEALAFRPLLDDWTPVGGRRPHYVGRVKSRWIAVLPMAGAGNVNAALSTREAIAVWNPELLLLAGIAGGFNSDDGVQFGDVLVPEQVVGYESGKLKDGELRTRYESFRASHDFLKICHFLRSEDWWRQIAERPPLEGAESLQRPPEVQFGVVASGEKVIADAQWGNVFVDIWPRGIGVEMEGIGVAQAAYDREVPFGVIKAISDFADRKKNDGWQAYAASVAATFVTAVIAALGDPKPEPPPQPQVKDSPLSVDAPIELRQGWGDKKVELCNRMTNEEAGDLADYFEVPSHQQKDFGQLRSICKDLWMWLEYRRKLSELPFMLTTKLRRADLAELILDICP